CSRTASPARSDRPTRSSTSTACARWCAEPVPYGGADLLVISPNAGSSFVEADVRELRNHFDVDQLVLRDCRGKVHFLRSLRERLAAGDGRAVLLWFLTPAYSLGTMALARCAGRARPGRGPP